MRELLLSSRELQRYALRYGIILFLLKKTCLYTTFVVCVRPTPCLPLWAIPLLGEMSARTKGFASPLKERWATQVARMRCFNPRPDRGISLCRRQNIAFAEHIALRQGHIAPLSLKRTKTIGQPRYFAQLPVFIIFQAVPTALPSGTNRLRNNIPARFSPFLRSLPR